MPKYSFDFSTTADHNGIIRYQEELTIPMSVKLKRLHFQTFDNCLGRSHNTSVAVNGETWITDAVISDCEAFEHEKSVSVSAGPLTLEVQSSGFNENETVSGKGWVEYSLSLFGSLIGKK
jgi:hypothetical protein